MIGDEQAGGPPPPPIAETPEGRAAIQTLMRARVGEASAGRPPLSSEEEEGLIRTLTGGKYGSQDARAFIKNAGSMGGGLPTAAMNGAMMGWEPDLAGKAFGSNVGERERLGNDVFNSAHPAAAKIAGILGSMAPFLTGAGEIGAGLKGAGLGTKVAASTATGMATGATAGAGYAGPGQRLPGAAMGGMIGAGLGAAAPLAGGALAAANRDAAPASMLSRWMEDPSVSFTGMDAGTKAAIRQRVAQELEQLRGAGKVTKGLADQIEPKMIELYGDDKTAAHYLDQARVERALATTTAAPAPSAGPTGGDMAAGLAGHLLGGAHAAVPSMLGRMAIRALLKSPTAADATAAPALGLMAPPAGRALDPIEQLLQQLSSPAAAGAAGAAAPAGTASPPVQPPQQR